MRLGRASEPHTVFNYNPASAGKSQSLPPVCPAANAHPAADAGTRGQLSSTVGPLSAPLPGASLLPRAALLRRPVCLGTDRPFAKPDVASTGFPAPESRFPAG